MACIVRTRLARQDLKSISYYLEQESQNRDIALQFLDLILDKCDIYAAAPEMGEACPELGRNVRRFIVGHYVVFYRPMRNGIQLIRVLHGGRDTMAAWRRR
ncbi:MAG: type II toxin-antitoxin system RelE/ParE family toxin [Planctomycetia bacterium]|nr:type II toxin-antitoxin system RelE/ParE family toxin [Planctomycetia bacterium]